MNGLTILSRTLLLLGALFMVFWLRADPQATYQTEGHFTVRTKTALGACALICLAGWMWVQWIRYAG